MSDREFISVAIRIRFWSIEFNLPSELGTRWYAVQRIPYAIRRVNETIR